MSYSRANGLMWEIAKEGQKFYPLIRTSDGSVEGITGPQGRYVTFSLGPLETLTISRPHDYVTKYTSGMLGDEYVMEKALQWLLQGIF